MGINLHFMFPFFRSGYRLDEMERYWLYQSQAHATDPKRIDEALYTPYQPFAVTPVTNADTTLLVDVSSVGDTGGLLDGGRTGTSPIPGSLISDHHSNFGDGSGALDDFFANNIDSDGMPLQRNVGYDRFV